MARIDQYSRIINHSITTSGQTFTIPTSNDHTDQTWLSTDLYIGEIGANVTDDKVYIRTNNGIIQLGTSASNSAGATNSPFIFTTPNITISSTYSVDAIIPRSGYFTDLGSSTLPWKDLYVGGRSSAIGIIYGGGSGLQIKETSNGILASGFEPNDNTPIVIYGTVSASTDRNRPLMINSKDVYMQGSGNQRVMIASNGVIMGTASDTLVSGQNVVITPNIVSHVHLGYGYNKTNYNSYEVVVGGSLAVRGVADDGSTQYGKSDWITTQDLLRTSTAATTNIASIPWGSSGIGCVMQVKAYLIGTNISDPSQTYSAEIVGCYYKDSTGTFADVIGNPVINEMSSWGTIPPSCEMNADATNVYIKVSGTTATIQWLCSYSFHQLINITV